VGNNNTNYNTWGDGDIQTMWRSGDMVRNHTMGGIEKLKRGHPGNHAGPKHSLMGS